MSREIPRVKKISRHHAGIMMEFFGYAPGKSDVARKLAEEFKDEPMIEIKTGELYTLERGTEMSMIHFEPHITTQRIFM